jgi:hypothetical protein
MQAPRSRPPDRYHSPSKRPHNRRAPRGAIDRNRSSDRRDRDPASPGVRDFRPSTDVSNARPLPEPSPSQDPASGGSEEPRADGTTRPAPVPTSWFRTTSPAFSARRTAGLLHPAAGPGVRRVSCNPLPRSRARATRARSGAGVKSGRVSRDASTLRRVPPARSRTVSPPPVCLRAVEAPPGGHAPRSPLPVGGSGAVRRSSSTSRRCSANGSVASDTLSGTGIARSFHGLVSPSWSDFLRSPP